MSQTQSIFFRLPQELRDEVYNHYVWEKEGYLYNSITRKMEKSNGQAIDIALNFTCKSIANEIGGLALKSNDLRF
jgi:hypothetical protein